MLNNKVEICGVNTAKLPILKREEKKALFDRILNGDEEARETYIFGNLRLVLSIIQRFNNRGEYVDDIFQVGCIGLIKAIDNFDVTQGVQFSTYAVPMNVYRRKERRNILMTRKQALYKALQVLTDEETVCKINEILDDMPFTGWSERTIFDTIDQFIIDNGRIPTTTDFKKKGLPPHPVIKLRFGITLKEFLIKYYPNNKLCESKVYYNKTKEDWKENFISDYIKIKPTSAESYNNSRTKGLPSWATVANMFGINKWLVWISFCDLNSYKLSTLKPRGTVNLKISSRNDLEE